MIENPIEIYQVHLNEWQVMGWLSVYLRDEAKLISKSRTFKNGAWIMLLLALLKPADIFKVSYGRF